jgi:hypothetical protein
MNKETEQELLAAIKSLKQENTLLLSRLAYYESDGTEKLLNSLQRKANEMAELLNKHKLSEIDLDDKNSKAFERIRVVWTDAKTISESILALKGGTPKADRQEAQTEKVPVPLSAEIVADLYGTKAGQK